MPESGSRRRDTAQVWQAAAGEFRWPVRVYYEDTDAAGVVYYANYLHYLERARTECLRAAGFEQDRLARVPGVVFVVRALEIDYRRPARFNDELVVSVCVTRVRGASLDFAQRILRAEETCCEAHVRVACLDATSRRPRAIPPAIVKELSP